jgi:hypothetical protein
MKIVRIGSRYKRRRFVPVSSDNSEIRFFVNTLENDPVSALPDPLQRLNQGHICGLVAEVTIHDRLADFKVALVLPLPHAVVGQLQQRRHLKDIHLVESMAKLER